MPKDLKFDAATPSDRGSPSCGPNWPFARRYCRPAAWTKALNGEAHGSNHSREGQDPSSSRGWAADRRRYRAGAPRAARSGGQAGHRDHDGGQQAANSFSPRPWTHGLTPAGPVPARPKRKTPPKRGLSSGTNELRGSLWSSSQAINAEPPPRFPPAHKYFSLPGMRFPRGRAPAPDLDSRARERAWTFAVSNRRHKERRAILRFSFIWLHISN